MAIPKVVTAAPDGAQRNKTEIVISDMVILDRKMDEPVETEVNVSEPVVKEKKDEPVQEVGEEDIPF